MTHDEVERLVQAGGYDPTAVDDADQRALLERLLAQGLTVDELVSASRLGDIVLRFETPVTLHRLERADGGFRTPSPASP